MTVTPLIIAVEGLDASGKSTQADLLRDALHHRGLRVDTLSFPRYDSFFGSRIGALLRGDETVTAATLDPRSMALWFAMDRWDSMQNWSATGDVLLINRWTLSNAVYQGARAQDAAAAEAVFDWVLELEFTQLGLPRPTLTVLLDLSVETSMRRAQLRATAAGSAPDVYESHATLLETSRHLYRRAAAMGHGVLVDVEDLTPQAVHEHVVELVDSHLP